ncbi:MAG: SIS domain-containing protein, partial [Solobacterium sp.]|nr:SIS domain-containing protein [Solobacterium sp.]
MITTNLWKEDEGANLRNFHENEDLKSVNGALALRKDIEKIIDQIWNEGFDNIFYIGIGGTYASAMQVEVYMRGRSKLPVYVENAAEFLTTGNKRFTNKSIAILSSVSGNTLEMIELVDKVHEIGGKVFSFIDTPNTVLTQPDKQDYLILYPKNEQLKFYMTANYFMFKNGEFSEYEDYNQNMEENLAKVLVNVEKQVDAWAYHYAKQKVEFLDKHPDLPHYFIGAGNQYGATYS